MSCIAILWDWLKRFGGWLKSIDGVILYQFYIRVS